MVLDSDPALHEDPQDLGRRALAGGVSLYRGLGRLDCPSVAAPGASRAGSTGSKYEPVETPISEVQFWGHGKWRPNLHRSRTRSIGARSVNASPPAALEALRGRLRPRRADLVSDLRDARCSGRARTSPLGPLRIQRRHGGWPHLPSSWFLPERGLQVLRARNALALVSGARASRRGRLNDRARALPSSVPPSSNTITCRLAGRHSGGVRGSVERTEIAKEPRRGGRRGLFTLGRVCRVTRRRSAALRASAGRAVPRRGSRSAWRSQASRARRWTPAAPGSGPSPSRSRRARWRPPSPPGRGLRQLLRGDVAPWWSRGRARQRRGSRPWISLRSEPGLAVERRDLVDQVRGGRARRVRGPCAACRRRPCSASGTRAPCSSVRPVSASACVELGLRGLAWP